MDPDDGLATGGMGGGEGMTGTGGCLARTVVAVDCKDPPSVVTV